MKMQIKDIKPGTVFRVPDIRGKYNFSHLLKLNNGVVVNISTFTLLTNVDPLEVGELLEGYELRLVPTDSG